MRTISISQSPDAIRRGFDTLTPERVAEVLASHALPADVVGKLSVTGRGVIERGANVTVWEDNRSVDYVLAGLRDLFGLGCAFVTDDRTGYAGCSKEAPDSFYLPWVTKLGPDKLVAKWVHAPAEGDGGEDSHPLFELGAPFPSDPNGPNGPDRSDFVRPSLTRPW